MLAKALALLPSPLIQLPLGDIPENAHTVVPQNRLLGNALEVGRGDIDCIDIRQESIRGIFRQRNLKIGIELRSLCGIVRLPGLPEQLVYLRIRIAAVVGSLVCAEDFIGCLLYTSRCV